MRERPILFSGPMVRAILDGRKTQTRRVVKLPGYTIDERDDGTPWPWRMSWAHGDPDGSEWGACPYGQPGDRLWVRETWALFLPSVYDPYNNDWSDVTGWDHAPIPKKHPRARWVMTYAATDADKWETDREARGFCWRPSIHMPRWASRLTLDVVRVRVERLQDISEADVAAEGVTGESVRALWEGSTRAVREQAWRGGTPPLHAFAPTALWHLAWSLINGEASWNANPWVWVVEFARLRRGA